MKRRYVAFIASSILSISLMAGCGEAEPVQDQRTMASPATEVGSAVEVPTEVPEATEALEVTENAETTEAVTPTEEEVNDNPDIIDGVDFTDYRNGSKRMEEVLEGAPWDEPRYIIANGQISSNQIVEAVMKNSDKIELHDYEDDSKHGNKCYFGYLYVPDNDAQQVQLLTSDEIVSAFDKDVLCQEGDKFVNKTIEKSFVNTEDIEGNVSNPYKVILWYIDFTGKPFSDEEISFNITHKDGSEETFTVTITKDFEHYTF